MNNIKITNEFNRATELLENSNENLFITGKAGTGKSTFLEYFRKKSKKNVVVVAPTGVAALNVRAQTIHSFFRFRPRFLDPISIKKNSKKIYSKIDILIIDEISMVRADIFDGIERFMRINGKHKGQPFGGAQICVIGDLYQLPPIIARDEQELYYHHYQTPFFFSAHSYKEANFENIEFEEIFRQTEFDFISNLNKIRIGHKNPDILDFLNKRHVSESELDGEVPVILTGTNALAEATNREKLSAIKDLEYYYEGKLEGKFGLNGDRLPAPEVLTLKKGAQVMFTKNDPQKRWVNGTIGTISKLSETSIDVIIPKKNGIKIYTLEKESWEQIAYEFDEDENIVKEKIIGKYTQYPLILAWAVTIHKSQGKTLDSVIINLGRGAFAPGQLYVALSRCSRFDKIVLKNRINSSDIQCDKRVVDFSASC